MIILSHFRAPRYLEPPFSLCLSSRSGEGNGTPFRYSCLENPMDGGAWWAAVHGVAKSRARLSDFTFTFHFHALKKEMATHSSVLAWRIPGTGEPGGLPSMGSHRVGHDWSNLAAAAASSRSGHCDYWMVTVPLSVDMPFLESPNSVTIISVDKIQSSARSLKKEWACGPGWARGPQPSSTESCFLIIRVI